MQELDSDVDDQGALVADVRSSGFPSSSSRRFASDQLRFTGIHTGERTGNQSSLRRATNARNSSDEEEEDEDEDSADDGSSSSSSRSRRQEEALFESAMARIRQARVQGRVDVDLTRAELEAVNRMAERKRREAEQRRRQEQQQQRVSIPISQLDPSSFEDLLEDAPSSRRSSPPQIDDRQGYPPVGYFPAPKGRQRSSTTSSRTAAARGRIPHDRDLSPDRYSVGAARPRNRHEDTSPFRYSYVSQNNPPPAIRQSSDPNRVRGSRVPSPRDLDEMHLPPLNSSAPSLQGGPNVDPFQYMTTASAGPRAPLSGAAAAARRRVSVSNPLPAAAGGRSRGGSRRVSPDATEESSGDDTASDDYGQGARVAPPTTRRTVREPPVIIEEPRVQTPEPRRSSRSKGASSKSPAKRKPASGSSNATGGSSRSKKKR